MRAHDATRVVAVVCGVLGLGLFYQPWVEGKLAGIASPVALTGLDLAAGRTRDLVDAASAPPPRVLIAAPGGAPAPAPAPAVSGGLALPTRVPTFAPGAQGSGLSMPAATTPTPPSAPTSAPVVSGGLTLPTRVPTFAPGAVAPTPATRPISTPGGAPGGSAGTGGSSLAAAALGATSAMKPPVEQLPKLTLYVVPVAGAGIAVFTATFGMLRDPRDRRFAKWWTVLFGLIGAWASGTVVTTVGGSPAANDLLAPGQAMSVMWAAWGSVASFATSAIILAWTWISAARRERDG